MCLGIESSPKFLPTRGRAKQPDSQIKYQRAFPHGGRKRGSRQGLGLRALVRPQHEISSFVTFCAV